MIVRLEAWVRKARRRFSRDVWMARLLRLPSADHDASQHGLVMVQIDGLSFSQLEIAMQKGRMPFLSKLMKKEGYIKYRHYSGMPSNTPAVQGHLFYGVRGCVPAFSFKSAETGQISHMFKPELAMSVENDLKTKGPALLEGGSSYGNIFTGGAAEPHFCASSIGWGTLLKAVNPLRLPLTVLLNFHIFVRAFVLMIAEFFIALSDVLRGLHAGISLRAELGFIPLRVAVCVLLRETVAAGARIDIARGLRVIHLNFAGYDEQAHHRGPSSAFAHWSLGGIDQAVEKLWKASANSQLRDYDFFVYSDHGQEDTIGYSDVYGKTIQEAINPIFKENIASNPSNTQYGDTSKLWRDRPTRRDKAEPPAQPPKETETMIAAMGAVGHIYSSRSFSKEEREAIALDMVSQAKIPLVLVPSGPGKVRVWSPKGVFSLPEQADQVLEATHPFLNEAARDLVALCHHRDAGDFVILGWHPGKKSLNFYHERGSHAGPGPEETSGFALLPPDALPGTFGSAIDTGDLRAAAFCALDRGSKNSYFRCAPKAEAISVRVMTYNVHGCMGRDGKVSPNRIARIISRHNPDIVCLQELDTRHTAHQAEIIAQKLEMTFEYHSSLAIKTGTRGNAVFSRFPMRLAKNGILPHMPRSPHLEPRGALWVEIDFCGKKIQLVNTHLSLSPAEGLMQMEALLGPEWMAAPSFSGPAMLCGDLNAMPGSKICRRAGQFLKNAQMSLEGHQVLKTLPSYRPIGSVDHVFVSPRLEVVSIDVPNTRLERIASDHLPLIAEIKISV